MLRGGIYFHVFGGGGFGRLAGALGRGGVMNRWAGLAFLLVLGLPVGGLRAQVADSQIRDLEEMLGRVKKDFELNEAAVLSDFEKQIRAAAGDAMEAYRWFKEIGGQEPQYDRMAARKMSDSSKGSDKEEDKKKGKSGGRSAHEMEQLEDATEATQGNFKNCLQRQCQLILHALRLSGDPAAKPGADSEFVGWMVQTTGDLAAFKGFPQAREAVSASLFVKYYRPSGIGEEAGTWSMVNLPEVYRKHVIALARTEGSERLESAWNTYIGMRNILEGESEKWPTERLPQLEFEREVDLFQLSPSRERYVDLVNRLRAQMDNPQFAGMYDKLQGLLEQLKQGPGGAPAAGSPPPVE
jgi:hypothetical protein